MHSDLSMQKEFDIKWKSHDISGSASLALWANMNQSTTQLGSKRQSQGKHPYLTINIFICCCVVIIFPVSIYFYVSYYSFSDVCGGLYFISLIFVFLFFCFVCICLYFLLFIFTKMVFLPAAILPCQQVCFKCLWCSSLLYALFTWGHTLCHYVDFISMDLFFLSFLFNSTIFSWSCYQLLLTLMFNPSHVFLSRTVGLSMPTHLTFPNDHGSSFFLWIELKLSLTSIKTQG